MLVGRVIGALRKLFAGRRARAEERKASAAVEAMFDLVGRGTVEPTVSTTPLARAGGGAPAEVALPQQVDGAALDAFSRELSGATSSDDKRSSGEAPAVDPAVAIAARRAAALGIAPPGDGTSAEVTDPNEAAELARFGKMKVTCPHCRTPFHAPIAITGRLIQCARCQKPFKAGQSRKSASE